MVTSNLKRTQSSHWSSKLSHRKNKNLRMINTLERWPDGKIYKCKGEKGCWRKRLPQQTFLIHLNPMPLDTSFHLLQCCWLSVRGHRLKPTFLLKLKKLLHFYFVKMTDYKRPVNGVSFLKKKEDCIKLKDLVTTLYEFYYKF